MIDKGINMDKLEKLQKALDERGKILTLEAEEYIRKNIDKIDVSKLIEKIDETKDLFITVEILEMILEKTEVEITDVIDRREKIEAKIKVIYDPGKKITRGTGFNEYFSQFQSRYKKLKTPILTQMKIRSPDFLATLSLEKKESYNIIGIVYSKKITRDRIWLEIEDETGVRRVLVSRGDSEKMYRTIQEIPLDSVIGLKVILTKTDLLIAKEVYLPSVQPNNGSVDEDIFAILTSDIHVGSEKFLEDEFKAFIDILNGYTDDERLRTIISRTKYLIIAGDIVDGIGVFPDQEKELLITDIREQYKEAYRLLSKIPQDIKIIMVPGNHDATRKALPQPPISEEYAEEFYKDERFLMLGNPVNVSLHGVNMYIYHGDFLQDTFTLIPGITQNNLDKAMQILLQVRHAAPTFGVSTRIGPEPIDKLVLPEKLDVFHTGHIHRISVGNYNNILMINSGTWQKQTKYQKANGYEPTPGIVPIVNLKTKKVVLLNLLE